MFKLYFKVALSVRFRQVPLYRDNHGQFRIDACCKITRICNRSLSLRLRLTHSVVYYRVVRSSVGSAAGGWHLKSTFR